MSSLKQLMLEAGDSDLDASMFPLIEKWDDPPKSLQILEVLDHCIHGALASGFTILALQMFYDEALKTEGRTHEDNLWYATWRDRT